MSFTLDYIIEPAQDGTEFKIIDRSNWDDTDAPSNDPSTYSSKSIELYNDSNSLIGSRDLSNTEFNAYLSNDGLEVTTDMLANYDEDYFVDGYYEIKLSFTDSGGTTYDNRKPQGFLAFARLRAKRLPLLQEAERLDYVKNEDTYSINIYLTCAEYSAELGLKDQFIFYMNWINKKLNTYNIKTIIE